MSLGLVAYGDSDDSGEEETPCTSTSHPRGPRPETFPHPPVQPDFKRPPPSLFPSVNSKSNSTPKAPSSTYSQLVERDENGRIRVTAPRLEDHDSDEEDNAAKQFKKPKIVHGPGGAASAGLMAVLPKPEGPKKKGDVAKDSSSVFDQMFARKRKDTNTTETIKVQGASQIRYEAEMKKAQLLQKYRKKALVEEPEDDDLDFEQQYAAAQAEYVPPAEPDYLGLSARGIGNVCFAETPQTHQQSGGSAATTGEEETEWEVDESAYEADDYALGTAAEYEAQMPQQPAYNVPLPGAMWTANYKYQDVQNILENPRMAQHAVPAGYKTDQQVEKLIARYEGPEFQEYLNMGNTIDIVDVRADDHLGPNPRANVMKQLTEQEANPPPRPMVVKGKVNKTAKAKGQITFLAAQAVARESELQNEWSRNRQARQQASHRYGF
ncbi:hypothetical protein BV898_00170 [Hypsibius exemplaris]|uniref:Proline-rich protein PRCC n=1 Tax=Hypsibius exemplaris TaxID=2072580 RepID=A0A1W0XEY1_HYPEX|nr:hypothetical protein BV898_00170 [Hypsibius exemplaris]